MSQKWKEAATVILTSLRTKKQKLLFNYDVLSIKRSAKNSFMPGTYVFPGGATHRADGSKRWLEIFSKFNLKYDTELNSAVSPPILISNDSEIPKLIALKIAAIRETFEETGILLCHKGDVCSKWTSSIVVQDLNAWRTKVVKDASDFFSLCKHLNCCPDINGLHLWSNWLTPRSKPKRFDTVFFIASLPETPSSATDDNEIDEILWCTPAELLQQSDEDSIILPPPQIYELSRLMQYTNSSDLIGFAQKRASLGCDRWMPQYLKTSDGAVSLLPGDDAYNVDSYEGFNVPLPVIEMTKDEFRSKSKTLHRFEGKKIIVRNYEPKNGHILPVS